MKKLPAFTLTLLLLSLTGCVTTPPREVLANPASMIVATGFEPIVRGINVGTTVFSNQEWRATPGGFDANATVAATATHALLQPVAVIDGVTIGLFVDPVHRLDSGNPREAGVVRQLTALGRAQRVDRIVLLATGNAPDWIAGTNQRLTGLGLYRRGFFGAQRIQVYGVFQLYIFDCSTQKFSAFDALPGAQEVYSVEWHKSWDEFSPGEQHRITAAWKELLERQTAQLLTRAGLANAPLTEKTLAENLQLIRPNRPKSWLPEGNALPIPQGVPAERAHAAVLNGLKARGWTLVSEKDREIIGVYREGNGKKEASVIARLSDTEIQLIGDDHEIKADGSRVPAQPFTRWQNNLKESIYRDLLLAEEAVITPEPAIP